jgi:polyisoprenoid-binding protein YceI
MSYKHNVQATPKGLQWGMKAVVALCLAMLSQVSLAQWTLDNDASSLSFVTIKAEHVAEVHTFDRLSGSIASNGSVSVEIELASVNTLIPIRNERMQAMLFETNMFPSGTVTAEVDISALASLAPGAFSTQTINFSLNMHGFERSYNAEVRLTRLNGAIQATTLKPVVVTAEDHGLVSGVEALREVAGLPSISRAVPVSFTLTFNE